MDKEELDNEIERLQQEALNERNEIENNDNDDSNNNSSSDEHEEDEGESDNAGGEDSDNDEEDNDDNSNDEEEEEEKSDSDENREELSNSFESIEVESNGKKISLDSIEEVKQYIESQNRIMHKALPKSALEQIAEQAGFTKDDLALLADIKAGKAGALNKLAKDSKIDLGDADDFEGDYQAEFKPQLKTDVDIVIDEIKSQPELSKKFGDIARNLPDDFLSVVTANANDLRQFTRHVESGLADELLALATKEVALGNGSLLENYIKFGEAKAAAAKKENDNKNSSKNQKREISDKEKNLRKRASADADENKSGSSSELTVDDIWEMTPEERAKLNLRDLD